MCWNMWFVRLKARYESLSAILVRRYSRHAFYRGLSNADSKTPKIVSTHHLNRPLIFQKGVIQPPVTFCSQIPKSLLQTFTVKCWLFASETN